ncbi:CaiB/BaiF CoA transferase family protein [Humitalea sp. 24SJ18S-53]|uniref:CaiB/BaiF CoA transferase family protein n=1 Tax=Humitalea sp. 24SJ18S-53 TaxID=3422307 RepID=UPI003D678A7A
MQALPLSGLKVVEFTQMVMGPCCGLILADLGAEVIKIEPLPKGDRTRGLTGLAAGFFSAFNRNKRSIAVDMRSPEGLATVHRLVAGADILVENFRPGRMKSLGLDQLRMQALNPRLIYCSLKGFLPGPYDNRSALDEVVQMMGGLAYMTGLPGKPMRAGASVNDIMGAMFGVIAIQGAVRERERTGRGQEVQASLFENNVFLMAQAMLGEAVSGEPSEPWSTKAKPWPVYDLFNMADGTQLFVGIIGDDQWKDFCAEFEHPEWLADPRLSTNNDRAAARPWLLPIITEMLTTLPTEALVERLDRIGLPFAPVAKPGDLNHDPHLLASGGLIDITLPNGVPGKAPALPVMMDGRRLLPTAGLPGVGEHTRDILTGYGFSTTEVEALFASGTVGDRPVPPRRREDAA